MLKKSTTDAIKTTAEATGDLIGNKIADKITSVSNKKSTKELRDNDEDAEINTHKKDTCLQKKDNKLLIN